MRTAQYGICAAITKKLILPGNVGDLQDTFQTLAIFLPGFPSR
jgi:hypothetical protein